MAADTDLLLQKAIYDALMADATLLGLVSNVYDHVPQAQAFPYVVIGEQQLSPFDSHTFDGANTLVTIHTWARSGGRKSCKEIMAEIYRILHNAELAVAGFEVIVLRREFQESMLDPDGQTYHGVQRFRIILEGD